MVLRPPQRSPQQPAPLPRARAVLDWGKIGSRAGGPLSPGVHRARHTDRPVDLLSTAPRHRSRPERPHHCHPCPSRRKATGVLYFFSPSFFFFLSLCPLPSWRQTMPFSWAVHLLPTRDPGDHALWHVPPPPLAMMTTCLSSPAFPGLRVHRFGRRVYHDRQERRV